MKQREERKVVVGLKMGRKEGEDRKREEGGS